MISVKLEDILCESLIDSYAERAPERVTHLKRPPGASPVSVVRADNVLYIPDLRAPIVGRIMPRESILNEWYLEFERGRNFQGRADAYRQPFDCAYSDHDVCILTNLYSRNFGHWITEELFRVAIMEQAGFSGRYVMANLPRFAFSFMAMIGIPRERIIAELDGPTMFRSAWFSTPVTADDVFRYSDLFFALRDRLIAAAAGDRPDAGPRLWIDRAFNVQNPERDLINKDEVYPLLERYGFQVIDMAELPVAGQIAAASRANVIGGPHGAGFIHVMFMASGSKVVECFSPFFINASVIEICRIMRHRYSMIVPNNAYGAYPYGNQLKLNCSQLELVLQGLE